MTRRLKTERKKDEHIDDQISAKIIDAGKHFIYIILTWAAYPKEMKLRQFPIMKKRMPASKSIAILCMIKDFIATIECKEAIATEVTNSPSLEVNYGLHNGLPIRPITAKH